MPSRIGKQCTWNQFQGQILPINNFCRWPPCPDHHLMSMAALHLWLRHSDRGRLQTHIRVRQLREHLRSEECQNPRNRAQRARPHLQKVCENTLKQSCFLYRSLDWRVIQEDFTGVEWFCHRYVFFLDPCNIDILRRKMKSVALCVSKCPDAELKTYEDLTKFSTANGELSAVVYSWMSWNVIYALLFFAFLDCCL